MASRKTGSYILAIDQGTTGTTTLIVDEKGRVVASADLDFKQFYPYLGWVEHDLELIWKSVEYTVNRAIGRAQISTAQIQGIGITNQRETVGIWDRKSGKALHKAIVWQCRRTTDICQRLKAEGHEKWVQQSTGLMLDPYFSATKIQWLLKSSKALAKAAHKGRAAVGTIDSFLAFRLSGGGAHITDVSNASRTLLMNLKTLDWDEDLLKLFQVPRACLPKITDSSGILAHTRGLRFLPDGIPISGIAGDQQAALFGQACFRPGQAKCTYGTGSFILMNTGNKPIFSKNKLLTTVGWRLQGQEAIYALEGGAFVCGAAVQWLRDGLQLIKNSSDIEKLALEVPDSGGVTFVPALTGLGAPHWQPQARGLICGLTRGNSKAHIARATLEAMAFQNVDILTAMEKDMKRKMSVLRVDGGASKNNLLMQIQANSMGRVVERPAMIDSTSLGAAYLAGLGVGLWKNTNILGKIWRSERSFKSKIGTAERNQALSVWSQAVQRASL